MKMRHLSRLSSVIRFIQRPRDLAQRVGNQLEYLQSNEAYRLLFQKYQPFTMLYPQSFVNNLELINQYRSVPGCIVECGVWRGGCLAAIAEVLGHERSYHAFDSFCGLPPAQEIDGTSAKQWQADTHSPSYHDNCSASREFVEQAMTLAGAKDVVVHQGWFQETVPKFTATQPIAILRLDGDWYESTATCLKYLFPKMAEGGLVLLDDYYAWEGCARATHDFISVLKDTVKIRQWRNDVAYLVVGK